MRLGSGTITYVCLVATFLCFGIHNTAYADAVGQGFQLRKVYYGDGALKGEFQVEAGRLEGQTKWYHKNGAVGALLNYRENRLHGPVKLYHDNGNIKKMAYYNDGRLMTRWVFSENGQMNQCDEAILVNT